MAHVDAGYEFAHKGAEELWVHIGNDVFRKTAELSRRD